MTALRILVDSNNPSVERLLEAVRLLRQGQLVAFPTETVYGLGANAWDDVAVRSVFVAKGRPADHPLIVHVADESLARRIVHWNDMASAIAERFWPGPVTLVLPRRTDTTEAVSDAVTGGLDSVAIRMPAHPVARLLLQKSELPIAAPSANLHTRVSPTLAEHVFADLGARIAAIVDGGRCGLGLESAVISLLDRPRLLRPGTIDREQLREILPDLADPDSGTTLERRSPGLAKVHYAPNTKVLLVESAGSGPRIARLRLGVGPEEDNTLFLPNDPLHYAAGLYAALHALDLADCRHIEIDLPPSGTAWEAVHDRLRRAAAKGVAED